MSIDNLISYEILGAKEEFAGWVSNITPYDTPFVSETGKAPVNNRVFEWQTDRLDHADENAWAEGTIPDSILNGTKLHNNYTQILRKVVQVSDTVEAMSLHGRGSELEYQIEKATKELKLELEGAMLSLQDKDDGSTNNIRKMAGFYALTAGLDEVDPETGAVVHKKSTNMTPTEQEIFDITENLYMAGSRANTIMFHPIHARSFSKWMESSATRQINFSNEDEKYSRVITEVRDPLGQTFRLLPNDNLSPYLIYFYHPHDWFQRVLRPPQLTQLAKDGNYERWMLETEIGLQHRNPFASGILEFQNPYDLQILDAPSIIAVGGAFTARAIEVTGNTPDAGSVKWSVNDTTAASVDPNTGVVNVLLKKPFILTVEATFEGGIAKSSTYISIDVVDAMIDWAHTDDTGFPGQVSEWVVTSNIDLNNHPPVYSSSDDSIVSIGSHSGTKVTLNYLAVGTAIIDVRLTVGGNTYLAQHTVVIS